LTYETSNLMLQNSVCQLDYSHSHYTIVSSTLYVAPSDAARMRTAVASANIVLHDSAWSFNQTRIAIKLDTVANDINFQAVRRQTLYFNVGTS
jgi:hypothetical protein